MIGIRAEDKNRWERRAPLTPAQVGAQVRAGFPFRVQPSERRVFAVEEYRDAGAEIGLDLEGCTVVLGVKEVPPERIQPGIAYLVFSHVAKGQSYNMGMLARFLEAGCTLIDYEEICDPAGRRLIFFGRHAGNAGMIDALWALGQRLAWEGHPTPLARVRRALDYAGLEEAREHLRAVGGELARRPLSGGLRPLVVGITGSGNVAAGAREILACLPGEDRAPEESAVVGDTPVIRLALKRHHRYLRDDGGTLQPDGWAAHPERHRSAMDRWLPRLHLLVHGAFWDPRHPRLVTAAMLRRLWDRREAPTLRVIADISCDIGGGIEATVRPTTPGEPVYVYQPADGATPKGVAGQGPVILAVDNLPCEIPAEASAHFGASLAPFVPALHRCDWRRPLADLDLPREIQDAIIAHRGALAPRFAYLGRHLKAAERRREDPS